MQYTIKAVNPEVKTYTGKYGQMSSYKVLFEEANMPVEISQKATTPAPAVGQILEGTIDMSGQYGPKFKKEYSQGGNFTGGTQSGSQSSSTGGGFGSSQSGSKKFSDDPFTMYLSYAKDLAVAKVQAAAALGNDTPSYTDLLDQVTSGAYQLYEARPGAAPKEQPQTNPGVQTDTTTSQTSVIDTVFEVTDEPLSEEDLPWPEPTQKL